MRRIYFFIVLCVTTFGIKAQSPEQESIKAKNIYISFDFVKHLVFQVQVSDIEVGEKELISAERVEEAPHVVRLCAQSEDFEKETNVTVVCIDGSVYTYHVKYIANGLADPSPNIYEDNGKWVHNDYQADVSEMHVAEFSSRRTLYTGHKVTRCPLHCRLITIS